MGWNGFSRRTRIDLIRAILLVGLGSALAIWLTAAPPAADSLGDPLATSKVYRRALEMYGGTANVVAAEITDWFRGLWHGRGLAGTVAALSLAAALGVHLLGERDS
jgi:multisubunit Na+/H+ antiporter MnhB subunit